MLFLCISMEKELQKRPENHDSQTNAPQNCNTFSSAVHLRPSTKKSSKHVSFAFDCWRRRVGRTQQNYNVTSFLYISKKSIAMKYPWTCLGSNNAPPIRQAEAGKFCLWLDVYVEREVVGSLPSDQQLVTPPTHVRRQSLPVWSPTLHKIPLPPRQQCVSVWGQRKEGSRMNGEKRRMSITEIPFSHL